MIQVFVALNMTGCGGSTRYTWPFLDKKIQGRQYEDSVGNTAEENSIVFSPNWMHQLPSNLAREQYNFCSNVIFQFFSKGMANTGWPVKTINGCFVIWQHWFDTQPVKTSWIYPKKVWRPAEINPERFFSADKWKENKHFNARGCRKWMTNKMARVCLHGKNGQQITACQILLQWTCNCSSHDRVNFRHSITKLISIHFICLSSSCIMFS